MRIKIFGWLLVGLSLLGRDGWAATSTLFNANFDACGSGALSSAAATAAGTLNTGTTVGTWSYAGTAGYGAVSAANAGDKAVAFDHNTTAQSGMTMMPANGVAAGSTYPVTVNDDAPGPNAVALFANFAGAGGFTGTNSTAINFKWGSYGNNSGASFKYAFVRGLDASGNEVFELLWYQGSTASICQILARSATDTWTTLNSYSAQPVIQGTVITTNFDPGAVNSVSASTEPSAEIQVGILLTNNQVTYTINGGTPNTMALNSGATSISKLEFSEVWNKTLVDGQNAGFWLDDVSAEANVAAPVVSADGFPARINLAKYQPVTTDSDNGVQNGSYLTDGLVTDTSSWISDNSGPHWAQVSFPFPVTVGSAQMVMGLDNVAPPQIFQLQYLTNGTWVGIAGTTVIGNTNKDVNLVFSAPATAAAFRFYDSFDGTVNLRELALYPPNGTNGFPFGTDFSLDVARKQPAQTTANTYGNWPLLANDGLVDSSSAWETTQVGNNSLQINLQFTNRIGSAHLYSGATGVPPLSDFVLQYATGSGWANIPGASVSGNTSSDLVIPFTTPVTTKQVRLVFTNNATSAVRELCVFPANNPAGYPLGTGIRNDTPVTAKYDTYSDSYYYLSNAVAAQAVTESNGVPVLGTAAVTDGLTQYQVLLNYDTGTYRLINRATGLCLAGAQLTTNAGAAVAEEVYSALPDQDWYVQSAGGNSVYFVNQFSGLALDAPGGALVQNVMTNSASQQWQIALAQIYPKKGLAGSGKNANLTFASHWTYGWWYYSGPNLPGVNYFPMDPDTWYRGSTLSVTNGNNGNLQGFLPQWRTANYSLYLMGFNEPDSVNQANINPTNAAIAWLNDQSLDLPLVGPACANVSGTWNPIFFGYITNWGCRVDYLPAHEYGSPSGGNSSCWVNPLQTAYNTWGIPMWLTEFSIVDWPGNQSWSEEDNYNALAEFLWRAESISWLRKYSLFVFTADANNPMAPNPWTATTPAPRSNAYDSSGNLTPFGELYAAWDDDANVETNKLYYVHNSGTRKRLQNTLGATADATDIRGTDFSTKWTLQPAGGANLYYLVSALDGRRLSYTSGGAVKLVASNITDSSVQWNLTANQYGWYFLDHPATGKRLQLAFNNSTGVATFSMVANTTTGAAVKWRFIVPLAPTVWTGTSNPFWTTPGNWDAQQLPQAGTPAAFTSQSTHNLTTTLSANYKLSSLTVTAPAGPVSIGGANTLSLGGGGFDLSAANQDLTVTAPLVLTANQTWNVANGRALRVNGGVTDNGSGVNLTVAGGGTVTLGGAASYTGDTIVNAGATLQVGAVNALPAGNGLGKVNVNGTLDLNGQAAAVNSLNGSGVVDNSAPGTASLTVGTDGSPANFNGTIQNSGGALNLIKMGSGTLTLTSANPYTGNTLINAGTLALNGSGDVAGSSNILIAGGATLDVSAKSSGFTLNGRTLGNSSVGAMLEGNSDCRMGGLSLVHDGVHPSLVQTNGTLTLSAGTMVTVNNTGAPLSVGTYPIIAAATAGSAGLVSGTLPPVTVTGNGAAGTAALQINANGGLDLVVTVATNPTSVHYQFAGNDLSLTWPVDHLGWIAQSNAIDIANTNEWHDIPNSQSGTNLVVPINPQTTNVFYRLRYPN
jgi:autotransporter-associated beta strand protein